MKSIWDAGTYVDVRLSPESKPRSPRSGERGFDRSSASAVRRQMPDRLLL
ncbi:MAG: hypothetical protein AAGD35_14150 [Actinomycetota bacterium]